MRDPVLNRPLFRRAFQQGGPVLDEIDLDVLPTARMPTGIEALAPERPFSLADQPTAGLTRTQRRRMNELSRTFNRTPEQEQELARLDQLLTEAVSGRTIETHLTPSRLLAAQPFTWTGQGLMTRRQAEELGLTRAPTAEDTQAADFAAVEEGLAEAGQAEQDALEEVAVRDFPRRAEGVASLTGPPPPAPLEEVDVSGLSLRTPRDVPETVDPLRQAYDRRAALYGEIYGDPEQRRQEARTRIFLEIAERGLALAGGRTPDGQPTTGSFVSRVAQSFAGLPRTIGAEAAAITEQDRAMRMAQLQAAETEVDRDRQLAFRAEESERDREFRRQMAMFDVDTNLFFRELDAKSAQEQREIITEMMKRPGGLTGIAKRASEIEDFGASYEFGSAFRRSINAMLSPFNLTPARITAESDRFLNSFIINNLGPLAREISDRGSNLAIELAQRVQEPPGVFTTSENAANYFKNLGGLLASRIQEVDTEMVGLAATGDIQKIASLSAHRDRIIEQLIVTEMVVSDLTGTPRVSFLDNLEEGMRVRSEQGEEVSEENRIATVVSEGMQRAQATAARGR